MMAVFGMVWLVAWIKILSIARKPFTCAVIYVLPFLFYNIIMAHPFVAIVIGAVITFGYIALYFWLLDYFSE